MYVSEIVIIQRTEGDTMTLHTTMPGDLKLTATLPGRTAHDYVKKHLAWMVTAKKVTVVDGDRL